jgi:sporulation protein YlmC with PRC-barrel domain
MILSDLIHKKVLDADGVVVGHVVDVRFVIDGAPSQLLASARLHGIIVSRGRSSTFLGYERNSATSPVILAKLLAWRHRGSFLVRWRDVAMIDDTVHLRASFQRLSRNLPQSGS